MKLTSAALREHLVSNRVPDIVALASENPRLLSLLTALTYDPDPLISDRAVMALGLVSAVIAEDDSEYVRVHLRRLFWLLNHESGGIGWRAPECIGEILYHNPEKFAAFIPLLHSLLDMESEDLPRFHHSILRAIARLAGDPSTPSPSRRERAQQSLRSG